MKSTRKSERASRRRTAALLAAVLLPLALSGCGDRSTSAENEAGTDTAATRTTGRDSVRTALELTSPAFTADGTIPARYTCQGKDLSPPLRIEGAPEGTAAFALIVDDPDAVDGPATHWLLWDVPREYTEIPDSIPQNETVQVLGGAAQGRNDFDEAGYRGPCPPAGREHRYRFHLYALDEKTALTPGLDRAALEAAIEDHIVAEDLLIGRYVR